MSCRQPAATTIDLEQLLRRGCPTARRWSRPTASAFARDERTLVTGPSGAGKSTLFRAIAGIWPFGTGSIADPGECHADDAAAAAVFSGRIAAGGDRLSGGSERVQCRIRSGDALIAVGLPQLAARLEEEAHWNRMLSLGEQQRLGLARALLHAPQYLFLDEATASLDEALGGGAVSPARRRNCRRPPSSRSATARRSRPSISATSCWSATATGLRCGTGPRTPSRDTAMALTRRAYNQRCGHGRRLSHRCQT